MKLDEAVPSGERQPRPRRRGRKLVLGCVAAVALLALAYAARASWAGPLLVRWLAGEARSRLGAELTVERVSGNWWSELVLEGVHWRSESGPLRALSEARVTLRYTLVGGHLSEASVRVEGRGVELAIDGQSDGEGGSEGPLELPELPLIEVDLADVSLRRADGRALALDVLEGQFDAAGAWIDELALHATAGANDVRVAHASVDLAHLSLAGLERGFLGDCEIALSDPRPLLDFLGVDAPLRALQLAVSSARERAELTGNVAVDGGRLVLERGTLVWPAAAGGGASVDLALDADFTDLAPLGAALGRELAGRWSGALDVTGPLRSPTGRFVGRGEALTLGGIVLDTADVDVQTDGKTARIEHCELSGPAIEAVLRGGLVLEPLSLENVGLNVSADRAALAAVLPFPCEQAFVHARLDGPPTALRGAVEASATGAEFGRFRVDDAELRGTLDGNRLDLPQLRLTSGESFVEAAGVVTRDGSVFTAELAALALTWRERNVELERGARIVVGPDRFETEGLELRSRSAAGDGRAAITLVRTDGALRGTLAFERYEGGPLLATLLPSGFSAGRIDGRIAGALGATATPTLDVDLTLEGWGLAPLGNDLAARVRGSLADGVLALEQVELGFGAESGARVAGSLRVPFDPRVPLASGAVEIALALDVPAPLACLRRFGHETGLTACGPLRANAQLSGAWSALRGSVALALDDALLVANGTSREFDAALELALDERIRVARGRFTTQDDSVALEGALELAPDLPRLLADPSAVIDAPLALSADVRLADIGWLAGLSRDVRRVSGSVAGQVAVSGSIRTPELSGALAWRQGEARLVALDAPVRELSADVRFEGDVVHVDALSGEIGGAPVRARGTLEPFGPFPRVRIELEGDEMLIARNAHLVVRADAKLVVKGTVDRLSIRGELSLAEGSYRGEISPLEELVRAGRRGGNDTVVERRMGFHSGPLANAELDVHLGGTRTFEYSTNLFEVSLLPDVWVRGTGDYPELEGQVFVQEGRVLLPSGNMVLDAGLLTYRREQPLEAEAALKAEMRIHNYEVRAIANGPLGELGSSRAPIELSSTPPLPPDDLWVLVLSGQLPVGRFEDRNTQAMEALAVFLARDTIVRWFSGDSDSATNLLERIEIDVGAKPSQSGQLTGRVLFYLKPRTRTSSRATYISAELDEYDRVNYSYGIVFRRR